MAACASTAHENLCVSFQLYREAILLQLMQVNLQKINKLRQRKVDLLKFVASAGAFSTANP